MSQPQFHPVPQAPHATVAPPAQTAQASSSTSRPTTATAQDAISPVPATGTTPGPTMGPTATAPGTTTQAQTQTPAGAETLTLNDKLNAGDRYWKFKFGLMGIAIITGFIGIGCLGWIISTSPRNGYSYGWDSFWSLWPSLVTFSISIVWCVACILVFLVRKKTVHPGARVAVDLILWLAFIVTALFAMVALIDIMNWGSYDLGFGYYSSDGSYELAANGTWVWEQDTSYVSSPRDCNRTNRYYDLNFKDCAEQDAYVNKLWQEKPHRTNVELTGVVCQFFGLVLHFALFVWACVDTHRYNRTKVSKDAEKIAAGIVQTMIHNGAVVPPPGQAYMRPAMGQGMYYQLPQQSYPMSTMYPQQTPLQQGQAPPGQYPSTAFSAPGPVAGPSNEKSAGPRYA